MEGGSGRMNVEVEEAEDSGTKTEGGSSHLNVRGRGTLEFEEFMVN